MRSGTRFSVDLRWPKMRARGKVMGEPSLRGLRGPSCAEFNARGLRPTYRSLQKNRIIIGHGIEAITTRPPAGEATAERARLAAAQADLAELKVAKQRGTLLDAAEVESEWSGVLRTVRAGLLAVPSRVAQRLPHLTPHDVSEIEREVRAALIGLATADGSGS
jgi:Phage DNA packaging protein Nu1